MSVMALDPATWDMMTIEAPAVMPGGYAAGLTPILPHVSPLHDVGWQTHDHQWLGNSWVRVTLKRSKVTQTNHAPAGRDLRTPAERDADERHLAKLRAAASVHEYREEWFKGPQPTPCERAELAAAAVWAGPDPDTRKGTPIDDRHARRAWGTAP